MYLVLKCLVYEPSLSCGSETTMLCNKLSTFQSIRRDVSDVDAILAAPETQDEGVWKYEHLRQFSMELNGLAVALQGECQPETW